MLPSALYGCVFALYIYFSFALSFCNCFLLYLPLAALPFSARVCCFSVYCSLLNKEAQSEFISKNILPVKGSVHYW